MTINHVSQILFLLAASEQDLQQLLLPLGGL
jgi:hypothetical protein